MRGDRLRGARERAGLTQKDLAERVGTSDKMILRWENNKNEPSSETLARLAQELEISSDYLLGLSDSEKYNLNEGDLSPGEKRLISAARNGVISDLLESLATLAKRS